MLPTMIIREIVVSYVLISLANDWLDYCLNVFGKGWPLLDAFQLLLSHVPTSSFHRLLYTFTCSPDKRFRVPMEYSGRNRGKRPRTSVAETISIENNIGFPDCISGPFDDVLRSASLYSLEPAAQVSGRYNIGDSGSTGTRKRGNREHYRIIRTIGSSNLGRESTSSSNTLSGSYSHGSSEQTLQLSDESLREIFPEQYALVPSLQYRQGFRALQNPFLEDSVAITARHTSLRRAQGPNPGVVNGYIKFVMKTKHREGEEETVREVAVRLSTEMATHHRAIPIPHFGTEQAVDLLPPGFGTGYILDDLDRKLLKFCECLDFFFY